MPATTIDTRQDDEFPWLFIGGLVVLGGIAYFATRPATRGTPSADALAIGRQPSLDFHGTPSAEVQTDLYRRMQAQLRFLGYPVEVTGVIDIPTSDQMRRFVEDVDLYRTSGTPIDLEIPMQVLLRAVDQKFGERSGV